MRVLGLGPAPYLVHEGLRCIWKFDVREPTNPVSFATFPQTAEAHYCRNGGTSDHITCMKIGPVPFQNSRLICHYKVRCARLRHADPFRAGEGATQSARMMDPPQPAPDAGFNILSILRGH
jgi:hypothetical protein